MSKKEILGNKIFLCVTFIFVVIAIFYMFTKDSNLNTSKLYQKAMKHEKNGEMLKAYAYYSKIVAESQSSLEIVEEAQKRIVEIEKQQEIVQDKKQVDVAKKEKGLFSNYIIWAVPVFALLIIFEWGIARIQRRELYRLNDSISDLSCGITEQVSALLKTALFGIYTAIYEFCKAKNLLLFAIPNNIWTWFIAFIVVDFFYYWAHRFSHTTAIGWAGHAVHHQSEEFNFSVALRQGAFQSLFNFWFYLPMAVIGFHPIVYVATKSFNTIYQFWVHTRLINKMGFCEKFLNTPSHHRVHHGRNEKYIDKNYAGVFIIWDYMFGTFEPEKEQVAYGIKTPLNTWNPLTANLHYLWFIIKLCYRAPCITDKFKVWFMPPGWLPRGIELKKEDNIPLFYKYNPNVPRGLRIYATLQFVITTIITAFLFMYEKNLQTSKYFVAVFVMFSLVNVSAIFDRKMWAVYTEIIRLYLGVAFLAYFIHDHNIFYPLIVISLFIATILSWWINKYKSF